MKRRIAVRGIIVHENKLLCLRLTQYRNKNVNYWCVPGGGLDDNESIVSGLTRELIEELGIKPVVGKLLYVQQYFDKENDQEQMEFFFNIENTKDYLDLDLSKTTHGLMEIKQAKFIDPLKGNVLPKFLAEEKIDLNQDSTKFFSYL